MEELSELSPKLRLETIDYHDQAQLAKEYGVTRIPALVIGADGSPRVKFYGIPTGYELATIIEDVKTISRGVSPPSMETRKKLREVNQPVHIQVSVTPSCIYCPELARLAHAMALESALVSADVVEIQEFPYLAQPYGVRSLPLTVINEYARFSGAVPQTQLLEKVLEAGAAATQQSGDQSG